jgi:hypothetical protein
LFSALLVMRVGMMDRCSGFCLRCRWESQCTMLLMMLLVCRIFAKCLFTHLLSLRRRDNVPNILLPYIRSLHVLARYLRTYFHFVVSVPTMPLLHVMFRLYLFLVVGNTSPSLPDHQLSAIGKFPSQRLCSLPFDDRYRLRTVDAGGVGESCGDVQFGWFRSKLNVCRYIR